MGTFRRLVQFLAILSAVGLSVVGAQTPGDTTEPAWLAFEQAEAVARPGSDRDPAQALRLYAQALAQAGRFPEANLGIARIYREAGDFGQAERHYQRSLQEAEFLQIPAQRFEIRLELAEMYRESGNTEGYRNQILTILQNDPVFAQRDTGRQRRAMQERLLEDGLNRVLVLYRLDAPETLEAHLHRAEELERSARAEDRETARDHLMFAVVEIAGRAVDAIFRYEPDYQFSSIADLLITAARYPDVQAYLDDTGFISLLLRLASILEATPADSPEHSGAVAAAEEIRVDVQATLSLQR